MEENALTSEQSALIALAEVLSQYWESLPINVCNAWENYENAVPDGEFRDLLRK